MHTVQWSDSLLLDYAPMDEVHRDFVGLLARAQNANDAALPQAWADVIEHTVMHFGREDEWMKRTHFAAADNHIMQHRVVLNLLREGLALARNGDLQTARELTGELAAWFAKHTQTLDAALALHMRGATAPHPAARRSVRVRHAHAPH